MITDGHALFELTRIAIKHCPVLKPQDLLDEAHDPSSGLHYLFHWENSDVARGWRIYAAKRLILDYISTLRELAGQLEKSMSEKNGPWQH